MKWQELKQASIQDIVAWAESQPWCRAMADCGQDAEWHSEGEVWTHTKMVCQQLAELEAWPTLTSDEKTLLIFTALFHDAAKPLTSEVDPETGRISDPSQIKPMLKSRRVAARRAARPRFWNWRFLRTAALGNAFWNGRTLAGGRCGCI